MAQELILDDAACWRRYLASWLQALRNDRRCIFTAATQAQAAADWLLSHMGAEQAETLDEAA